ncbi:MAG: AraC family transcriptional regulator [Solirubrobacteraceae bacterium]
MSTQLISASDLESAVASLTEAYSEMTVVPARFAQRVRLRLLVATLPNLRLGDMRISKSMVSAESNPGYAVCLPIDGVIRISSGGATAHVRGSSGAVVSAGEAVRAEYLSDDSNMLIVHFERAAIEAELAAMLGHGISAPVRFDLQLTHVDDAPFARALRLLRSELDTPGGLTAFPEMSVRLGRLTMAGLLISHASNYSEELTRRREIVGPRAIREAIALIEDRPAQIETVADIASAVGLSVRALDDGFRRHVGTPPMTYLRQVRLARAHEELVAADADVTTATYVAGSWGFWHYGRFAAAYRRRYGCTPSQTLSGKFA